MLLAFNHIIRISPKKINPFASDSDIVVLGGHRIRLGVGKNVKFIACHERLKSRLQNTLLDYYFSCIHGGRYSVRLRRSFNCFRNMDEGA